MIEKFRVIIAAVLFLSPAGQQVRADPAPSESVRIPNFWNPRARGERIEAPQTGRPVRFLTDDEFPPLHFAGPDGAPTGFAVELARAVCERLAITCTVQARRFDTLLDALNERQGDVVAAAIPLTPTLREKFLATRPYFRWPARFAARTSPPLPPPSPEGLAGRSVGVIAGSAHAAYLRAFFPKAQTKEFTDLAAAEGALKRGETEYLFADGVNLALWFGGQEAAGCCAFTGGDYLENRYFGEGIGLVTRQEDAGLARALDDALQRLWDDGKYAELYLRFFPVSPF
ncbi:transporter substrate-binding domain-containing protein [Methylobacterium gregans]|uniref:Membrane-bound lytic murein transglycosylase F n=1 Tax=Methylobacterium gregans TaxID=374424 RepID=A0AA37MBT4_9HYPH|nr:transporter substrate-binding domain-containing protein [Methylobacterium gregans]MDQ0519059.1 polar amino acid transport system substrate-binding protein [Methylobacterium gregans]GJD80342.1 Membrane-bound lytic murein transglycosylase F [Methylobacterium gregans]GLS53766.1 ABC transporter substrate-binding protein [Methylobacterium gregans]